MFDTIYIDIKCPYCDNINEGVQTKGLDCVLETYNIGDKISERFRWLGGCDICDNCNKFYIVNVYVDKYGIITGKYKAYKET